MSWPDVPLRKPFRWLLARRLAHGFAYPRRKAGLEIPALTFKWYGASWPGARALMARCGRLSRCPSSPALARTRHLSLGLRLHGCSRRGWRKAFWRFRLAAGLRLRLPCGEPPACGTVHRRCPRLPLGARRRWQNVHAPGLPVGGPRCCWRAPVVLWPWRRPRDAVPRSTARWMLPKSCSPELAAGHRCACGWRRCGHGSPGGGSPGARTGLPQVQHALRGRMCHGRERSPLAWAS